jgi:hypothetical protein
MKKFKIGLRISNWIILILVLFSCSQKKEKLDDEQLLAKVGDKSISIQEFIHRSEFTIRPQYCQSDNYIHKKIILNSLIGEKLLALEAGENNDLTSNADFKAYLEGRKEQAMRKVLYYEEAYEKVKIDPNEIQKEFKVAGRKYKISYFSIPNKSISLEIAQKFEKEKMGFKELYQYISGDTTVPKREIHWKDPEKTQIHDALYKNPPQKGEVVGPINVDDEQYIFMKVNGWIDEKIISETAFVDRQQQVVEKITNEKAWEKYKSYASQIMHNKSVQFYKNTFEKLVNTVAPIYIQSKKAKEKLFNNSFWNNKSNKEYFSNLPQNLEAINHMPLFSVEGRIWKLEQFRSYLKRHPLVFRKEGLRKNNFAEQFKLAIVDMIRDYYITQDAYNKDYDKSMIVQRQVNIWRDHMLSLYKKYKYLESKNTKGKTQKIIVEKYLTSYIDSLQNKYTNDIEINIKEFEKIKLTGIDMIALQLDQPFPIVVPSFPLVTNDSRLDYGEISN